MSKRKQKNFETCVLFFSIFVNIYSKIFGPTIISYGFDRVEKTAQNAQKRISNRYMDSTLI